MRYFRKEYTSLRFTLFSTKLFWLAFTLILAAALSKIIELFFSKSIFLNLSSDSFIRVFEIGYKTFLIISILLLVFSVVVRLATRKSTLIKHKVKKALFTFEYGNPLHLRDFQRLPKITCKELADGVFVINIAAVSNTVEDLMNVSSAISSALNRNLNQYAVTQSSSDVAFNSVSFQIEDVTIDRGLKITDVAQLKQSDRTKLIVQQGTFIDLTTSGSILCAGKTRSGKTTAIISLLLQILQSGKDDFGSEVAIIDPKRAELSMCPHTYTINDNGEAIDILNAMKHFADVVVMRQKALNELSLKQGDAVHWWEANMSVSVLFIDEYLSLRATLPKKASKDNPEYSLDYFDGLLKKIVTMGASAGCYVIISIAEASVAEGGLPALIRSACSTKLLFRPTLDEARLIWDSEKLKDFNNGRVYNAGDAWFSSTDGVHDNVSYVHFPYMTFPVYRELSRLLETYYS